MKYKDILIALTITLFIQIIFKNTISYVYDMEITEGFSSSYKTFRVDVYQYKSIMALLPMKIKNVHKYYLYILPEWTIILVYLSYLTIFICLISTFHKRNDIAIIKKIYGDFIS